MTVLLTAFVMQKGSFYFVKDVTALGDCAILDVLCHLDFKAPLCKSSRAPSCCCIICSGSQKWRMLPSVFTFESCYCGSIWSLLRTSVATNFWLGNYALWYWHLCILLYCGKSSFYSVHCCLLYGNQFLACLSLTLLQTIVSTFFPSIQSDG